LKIRLALFLTVVFILTSLTIGCSKKSNSTNVNNEADRKQKVIVVVQDKETKAPIKDAKVNLIGVETVYTTDEMGKTPEIEVQMNKGNFAKYIDEVANSVNCGFVSLVVNKEGYGKHLEMDYSVYPGNSTALVKIELSKGKKLTTKCNQPDVTYIENLVKGYEKFEGEVLKGDNMVKYKVTVFDENKKPIEGAKVVIPEAKLSVNTDKKGVCQFEIPYDDSCSIKYPVNKEYGEITILTYKQGYASKALLKVHVNKDGKNNNINVNLKKSQKPKVEYQMVEPPSKWMEQIFNSYK
jgi:hypothetical protein